MASCVLTGGGTCNCLSSLRPFCSFLMSCKPHCDSWENGSSSQSSNPWAHCKLCRQTWAVWLTHTHGLAVSRLAVVCVVTLDLVHKCTHRAVSSHWSCPRCRAWTSGGRNKERVLLTLMMTSIGHHLLERKEDPSTDIREKNGKLLTFYMDVARVFCQFQEYWGRRGWWKGRLMSVHSQGPILSCLGDLGLPILAQPSLLPDTSCVKAPLEINQGARSVWALRQWKGHWTSRLIKAPCVLWWLFTDYPMSWGRHPLWGIHFGWAPFSLSTHAPLPLPRSLCTGSSVWVCIHRGLFQVVSCLVFWTEMISLSLHSFTSKTHGISIPFACWAISTEGTGSCLDGS